MARLLRTRMNRCLTVSAESNQFRIISGLVYIAFMRLSLVFVFMVSSVRFVGWPSARPMKNTLQNSEKLCNTFREVFHKSAKTHGKISAP
jgi:hypothetical protein